LGALPPFRTFRLLADAFLTAASMAATDSNTFRLLVLWLEKVASDIRVSDANRNSESLRQDLQPRAQTKKKEKIWRLNKRKGKVAELSDLTILDASRSFGDI
jgi:hypothetical protein